MTKSNLTNNSENVKENSDTKLDAIQRNAYLKSKDISPNQTMQLDLLFPTTIGNRNDLRHLPNEYARSSLFTARSKKEPRRTLMNERLFHYNEYVSLTYTGIELRAEDDELIFLQIMNYAQKAPLGTPLVVSIKDIVNDIGWSKNGNCYDKVRESISRLKANQLMVKNTKAYGKSAAMSLIQSYTSVNDNEGKTTTYEIMIDPNIIILFAGNTFTSHVWLKYRKLSPIARRLADYAESHKYPFPLSLEKFQKMCDSSNLNMSSWKQRVKKACEELVKNEIVDFASVDIKNNIYFVREEKIIDSTA